MAKARLFELPETKGTFQLKGIVSGVEKDKFYKSRKTTTGKDERTISFGIEFEKDKTYTYKVVNIYDVDKNGKVEIKRNLSKTTLTLITCRHNTEKQIVMILELV